MRRLDVARCRRGGVSSLLVLAFLGCLLTVAPRTNAVVGIEEFPVLTDASEPLEITAGADGAVWFTEVGSDRIGRADPAAVVPGTSRGIAEYRVPTPNVRPQQIVLGPDDALWFTERSGGIGRLDPAKAIPGSSAGITEYTPPTRGGTIALTVGPDHALWFTATDGGRIGRLDITAAKPGTDDGFTEFTTPSAATDLDGITAGRDGALWFTESLNHQLGRLDPAAATAGTSKGITEYPVADVAVNEITTGPDGALWFTEFSPAAGIGRLDPAQASPATAAGLTQYNLPTAAGQPQRIAVGPDNALWFAEFESNKIGRLDPTAVQPGTSRGITEYSVPIPATHPFGITAGPDHDMWFADDISHIGRLVGPGSGGPEASTVKVSGWSTHTTQVWRTVTDTVTVDDGDNPTGALSYRVYSDSACRKPVGAARVVPVTGDGPRTASFVPTSAGTYHWQVTYSGDAANAAVTTDCADPAQAFTVIPPPTTVPLTVSTTGTGTGSVADGATPPFVCNRALCTHVYPIGTPVTLTATPSADSGFASWTSCPAPSGPNCTVQMDAPVTVRAKFTRNPTVTVHIVGHGSVADGVGFSCAAADQPCTQSYQPGTEVTLTPTPAARSRFVGWSGACSGRGPCRLRPEADPQDVTARFSTGRVHQTGRGVPPPAAKSPGRQAPAPAQLPAGPRGAQPLPVPPPLHHHGCTTDPGFDASNDPSCPRRHMGPVGQG